MITIEPTSSKKSSKSATATSGANLLAIQRRDLSRFLVSAREAVGLSGKISVLLTGDDRIRAFNREYRSRDEATDVLSFPAPQDFGAGNHAGDLVISLDAASRQAAAFGHALETEVKILLLHGLLHLAGEDHENDAGEMERRERALRKTLNLPLGLIERNFLTGRRDNHRPKAARPSTAGKSSRRGGATTRGQNSSMVSTKASTRTGKKAGTRA